MSSSPQPHIVVLGAGVVGLQTALSLLEANVAVTLVSKFWPGDTDADYASPCLAGCWRSHSGPADLRLQAFEAETFRHWSSLLSAHTEETGLQFVPMRIIPAPAAETLWYRELVPNFQLQEKQGAGGEEEESSVSFTTICFHANTYLEYLLWRLGDLCVTTITHEVDELAEIFELPGLEDAAGVVNCTGMGAKELGDASVFPVKEQTVLVRGEAERATFKQGDGWEAYVIPQPGGHRTILGGRKFRAKDDWSENVDSGAGSRILERCKGLVPELQLEGCEFEGLEQWVGRVPARKGGLRVEAEQMIVEGRKRVVCHNYGHGGAGYQLSVGSSREVVRLVKEALA